MPKYSAYLVEGLDRLTPVIVNSALSDGGTAMGLTLTIAP